MSKKQRCLKLKVNARFDSATSPAILILLLFVGINMAVAAVQGSAPGLDVYPTHWWVGMKNPALQLLIHCRNFGGIHQVKLGSYPGVKLIEIHKFDNPNYLAIDFNVGAATKPGKLSITITNSSGNSKKLDFEFKEHRKSNGMEYAQGITAADLIYLIMPDRFSDGDTSNDRFVDMNDTVCSRSNPFLRHGGDLQGITNHLDYFNDLGVTALWLTPVVENDQGLTNEAGTMRSAYHGYAFTDQYKIDRRFGGNNAYSNLVEQAHKHGLKIIQDAVYNHFGDKHFLFVDPPAKNWFNQWDTYTNTNYNDQPLVDKYASSLDRNETVKGWFTPFMPDVNQQNPFVANFLIQYAIWAVQEFGIDGWRVDTYFYSDRVFLNRINKALRDEYPHISIFGETTTKSVTEQAFFCENNLNVSWKSNLPGVTDYEWFDAAIASLTKKSGSSPNVGRLYNILVQDILYRNPMNNEIFLDNHDQNRFFSAIGEDIDLYRSGIALLFTQRGIPQIYYGTEILMKNFKDPTDAEVRKDFPGGWADDSVNKFVPQGRSSLENEAYDYVKKLAHFRKNSSAIKSGKLMQFLPIGGVYVYFRYDKSQTVMCIMNIDKEDRSISFGRFYERTKGFGHAEDVIDGKKYDLAGSLILPPKKMFVFDLH